jgi:hypothetical protein
MSKYDKIKWFLIRIHDLFLEFAGVKDRIGANYYVKFITPVCCG